MIFRVPWKPASKGVKCSALVEAVDLFQTLASLAGLPDPLAGVGYPAQNLQGNNLSPYFDRPPLNGTGAIKSYVFSQFAKQNSGPGACWPTGACLRHKIKSNSPRTRCLQRRSRTDGMTPHKTKQQPAVGVCDLDGTFDEAVVVCSIAVPCCMRGAVCSTQALRTTTAGPRAPSAADRSGTTTDTRFGATGGGTRSGWPGTRRPRPRSGASVSGR